MKISVITVAFNAVDTIGDTIKSVASQTHPDIEHIIIDGASTDGTVDVIKSSLDSIALWVSEPDEGIYDAMNKGIDLSSGDVLGFLNADDIYADSHVLQDIAEILVSNTLDACYGDLVYVDENNQDKIKRYYSSKPFSRSRIAYGWMPAHPTLYIKRHVIQQYGKFKTDYKIAGDFEYVARIFGKGTATYQYLPRVLVKMKMGGVSTSNISSNFRLNREIIRACHENQIPTNIAKVYSKYLRKIPISFKR